MADGTSIGVMNEDDTELGSSPVSSQPPAGSASEKPRRSMKLKNKVYFQLLEVTNDLQKLLSERGAQTTKLNSAAVANLARFVNETPSDPAAMAALQKQFATVFPSIHLCSQEEFASYVSRMRLALNK